MEFDLRWLSQNEEEPLYWHVLAGVAAFTSHVVFNRCEPSVLTVLKLWTTATVGAFAGLWYTAGDSFNLYAALTLVAQIELTYIITIASSITSYRLSPFHPLAGYPGPLLAKISSWYWVSRVIAMTPRLDLERLHAKYGDFVRIGPNQLSILNVDAINPIYGAKGWSKGAEYTHGSPGQPNNDPTLASLHLQRSGAIHAERRKIWDKAFAQGALNSYNPVIYTAAHRLVESLEKKVPKGPIDLHKVTGFFTFDVMRALAFGDNGSMIEEDEDKLGILHELHVATDDAGVGMAIPWLWEFVIHFPFRGATMAFRDYVISQYVTRRTQGAVLNIKDIFHYLLNEDVSGAPPSDEQLANDSALVIIAGSDTTHLTMTIAICYLVMHPSVYKELQAEFDAAMAKSGNVVSINELDRLPVLNGVINESLRLQPPLAQGLIRRSPPNGSVVLGSFVPENTSARVPIYGVHRDPRCWSVKPNEFRPQRWYAPEKDEIVNKGAFMPFSVGPYSCIGRVLALNELRCGLATFFLKFDAKFAAGFKFDDINLGDRFLLNFTTKIPLLLTERKGVTVEYPTLML